MISLICESFISLFGLSISGNLAGFGFEGSGF